MNRVVAEAAETANYSPGKVLPPGSGTEGDDPNALQYSNLGHLAIVLCEAVDAAIIRGVDRQSLLEEVAQGAENCTVADLEAILTGKTLCPPADVLRSFGDQLALDTQIIIDAARRGGCENYTGEPTSFPGMPGPGY